jgi:uncharacterized protein VcgC/VcgE DUF2780
MMKRVFLALVVLAAVVSPGAAKMPSTSTLTSLASNPLVSGLMSSLGLNANQAVGGAGSLLGLASEKLAKADWSKISKLVPGCSSLISQAKALGGIKKFGSLAALAPAFAKMGLSGDQVKSIQPHLSDLISKGGGADLAKKFDDAIK